jgi:hypothetical protein
VVAVAAAAVLASGCGSSDGRLSKQEYVEQIRSLEASEEAREATDVYTKMAAFELPQAECAAKARTLHGDLEAIVDRVDALRPPAEVQRLQDEFVAAGRETVDTVGGLARTIADGDLRCGEPFNRRAYGLPSTQRAEDVIDELVRRGYRIRGE